MAERQLTAEQARDCGIGQGSNCCAFLTLGASGFICLQRSPLADMIYQRVHEGQTSGRTPESDFPSCQQEGRQ